jgi:hypothetical protein
MAGLTACASDGGWRVGRDLSVNYLAMAQAG